MDGIEVARSAVYKMRERREISGSEPLKIAVRSEQDEERCNVRLRDIGHRMRDGHRVAASLRKLREQDQLQVNLIHETRRKRSKIASSQ